MKFNTNNGWMAINKPCGITSADALNSIKRVIKVKKLGHAGTLDPFATGVLVVAFNEATKLINIAMSATKEYEFEVTWGASTDTLDLTGKITSTSDIFPTYEQIINVIPQFIGTISQTPPQYSAIKVGGRRAYDLARNGEFANIAPRSISIHSLNVISHCENKTCYRTTCSKGTYIRVLACDIAQKLESKCFVSKLARTKSGKFSINDTMPLDSFVKLLHNASQEQLNCTILPMETALDDILVQHVGNEESAALRHGKAIKCIIHAQDGSEVAVLCYGHIVALCIVKGQFLYPSRVINNIII